eukprot:3687737-Pyramimonas_sp.AAC.1
MHILEAQDHARLLPTARQRPRDEVRGRSSARRQSPRRPPPSGANAAGEDAIQGKPCQQA